jgi:hypothetical protein
VDCNCFRWWHGAVHVRFNFRSAVDGSFVISCRRFWLFFLIEWSLAA